MKNSVLVEVIEGNIYVTMPLRRLQVASSQLISINFPYFRSLSKK